MINKIYEYAQLAFYKTFYKKLQTSHMHGEYIITVTRFYVSTGERMEHFANFVWGSVKKNEI